MSKKQFAVLGLGKFGQSVARKLYENQQIVLGVDLDEDVVEDAEMFLTRSVIADATEEKSMRGLEIDNFDHVIVAMGNIESSILTVMLLKNLGVKQIIAKAADKRHGQILESIGVSNVIYPEKDMGLRVANHLLYPNVIDYIELSQKLSLEEIKISNEMVGKSLVELNLGAKYHISVLAILRNDNIITPPFSRDLLQAEDLLVVTGDRKHLNKFLSLN